MACSCQAASGLMQAFDCMSCVCAALLGSSQYFKLLSCPVLALQLPCSLESTVSALKT